ncbi:MAG: LppX_LprAFG lipoprotein [Acidimicrobiales bacterium]
MTDDHTPRSAPPDALLDALRAADPVDPASLPAADSPRGHQVLAAAMTASDPAEAEVIELAPTGTDGGAPAVRFVAPPVVNRRRPRVVPSPRGRLLAASAAVVAVLAAGTVALLPGGTSPALAAVADTASVSSGRVATTLSVAGSGPDAESGSASLEAVFDGPDLAVSVSDVSSSTDPAAAERAGQLEGRIVDDTVYVRDGDTWHSAPGGSLASTTAKKFLDPRAVLDTVKDLTDITDLGPATMDGVQTTHYRGVVDLGGESVANWLATMDPSAEGVKAEGQATVDLYVGSDGLLRHLDVAGNAQDPDSADAATFTLTTVFSDLGANLDVEAPANAVPFGDGTAVFGQD